MSAVVGAAVPAAVCRWGLCSCCPGVGRCLSGVNNHQRVALARCGCGYVYVYIQVCICAYTTERRLAHSKVVGEGLLQHTVGLQGRRGHKRYRYTYLDRCGYRYGYKFI